MKRIDTLRLLLLVFMLIASGCNVSVWNPLPVEESGEANALPITDVHEIADDSIVRLPVRWDFYWQKQLHSDDFESNTLPEPDARVHGMPPWTSEAAMGQAFPADGFATYRTVLHLRPGREYAIHIQQQLVAYRVIIDGKQLLDAGHAGTDAASTIPDRANYVVSFTPEDEYCELILHVSNFHLFRAGLRGNLAFGRKEIVDTYAFRNRAFDLVLIGFFLAVTLYNAAVFLAQPRETSFLLFALLCATFALRIPIMSEKVVGLLGIDVPFEMQLRLMATMNILSPPLVMSFLYSLFPNMIGKRSVAAYIIVPALFLGAHAMGLRALAPAMFALYLIVIGPMLVHACIILVRQSLRGNRSAVIMSVGMFIVLCFGFYAMYRNWKALDAAQFALIGFAAFAMLQSIALGNLHLENLRAREALRERLLRSRAALTAQRRDLELNLHDSLGGALTDLKILSERTLKKINGETNASNIKTELSTIRERIDVTNRMFRGQLLFMEDLELASTQPVTGLQMTLLRRYMDAGREIDFVVSEAATPALERAMNDDAWRLNLIQLSRELCTNDLKYGSGESHWHIDLSGPHTIQLRQWNEAPESGSIMEESNIVEVSGRARQRTESMGGELETQTDRGRFQVLVRLPITTGKPRG